MNVSDDLHRHKRNKIIFLRVVSRAPIFHLQWKKLERLAKKAVPTRKAVV
jgi:hypothetical protein